VVAEGSYLAADWSKQAYAACFPGQWQNNEVNHSSMTPDMKPSSEIHLRDCMELFTTKEELEKGEAWYVSLAG